MSHWLNYYQHLPERISPTAFHIGALGIGWYPLMYIAAFLTVYLLLRWRIKKGEADFSLELVEEFIFHSFISLLIGARLGYVLFYNLPHYLNNPIEIFLPIQITDYGLQVTGYYGMSYHGGLIGVLLATWYFARKNKISFLRWADFSVPAIPAGFFFGRLGNFLNGELFGRITTEPWGMYFPADPFNLRHPSQLYEAIFEGLVLFIILWFFRPHPASGHPLPGRERGFRDEGFLLCAYLFLYGLFRIFVEFFREPDPQIGFIFKYFTLGQIFSALMLISSIILWIYLKSKRVYNKEQ